MSLDALLRQQLVWSGDRLDGAGIAVQASGFTALDALLPGGGWPRGALVEILSPGPGRGGLSLVLPALAGVDLAVYWLAPPCLPCPQGLVPRGLAVGRLVLVRPRDEAGLAWAAEQIVRAPVAALLWRLPERALRRVQLAAGGGGGLVFCFREPGAARRPSPAPLRLQVTREREALRVSLFKRRGGGPAPELRLPLPGPLRAVTPAGSALRPVV